MSDRRRIAAALVEYRAFVRDHPDDPVGEILAETIRAARANLRERRRIYRACGLRLKPYQGGTA